jgi:hypothetical protein
MIIVGSGGVTDLGRQERRVAVWAVVNGCMNTIQCELHSSGVESSLVEPAFQSIDI